MQHRRFAPRHSSHSLTCLLAVAAVQKRRHDLRERRVSLLRQLGLPGPLVVEGSAEVAPAGSVVFALGADGDDEGPATSEASGTGGCFCQR